MSALVSNLKNLDEGTIRDLLPDYQDLITAVFSGNADLNEIASLWDLIREAAFQEIDGGNTEVEKIGAQIVTDITSGFEGAADILSSIGAAAGAALAAGFYTGAGGGGLAANQTGNVYIGQYTANNGVDVDTVTSAFIGSIGRAMAGYGGGRR